MFKIGTEGTYAPFTFHDASGQLTGFDVDIGAPSPSAWASFLEFVEGKWDGLIAGLDAKRYDAVINQSASPTRAAPSTTSPIPTSRRPRC